MVATYISSLHDANREYTAEREQRRQAATAGGTGIVDGLVSKLAGLGQTQTTTSLNICSSSPHAHHRKVVGRVWSEALLMASVVSSLPPSKKLVQEALEDFSKVLDG